MRSHHRILRCPHGMCGLLAYLSQAPDPNLAWAFARAHERLP